VFIKQVCWVLGRERGTRGLTLRHSKGKGEARDGGRDVGFIRVVRVVDVRFAVVFYSLGPGARKGLTLRQDKDEEETGDGGRDVVRVGLVAELVRDARASQDQEQADPHLVRGSTVPAEAGSVL
jgi:hypothetical protein